MGTLGVEVVHGDFWEDYFDRLNIDNIAPLRRGFFGLNLACQNDKIQSVPVEKEEQRIWWNGWTEQQK